MAITKQKKEEIIEKMRGIVKDSSTLVFASFKGLSVAQATEMRRALRAQEVGYTVAKKTLIKRAISELKLDGEMPEMAGEIALAYGVDELAPAREVGEFVKKFPAQLSFAGGVFGGRLIDAAGIQAIAAIPPLQTLRAQFVQLINSPRQRFAIVLSEQAKKQV